MRYLLIIAILLCMSLISAYTRAEQMMCTTEYAPVCSISGGQTQTYSNSCVARSQGVTDARADLCNQTLTPRLIGGDVDRYGCKGSAGYTWSPTAKQCIRPWESRIRILTIAPERTPCMGVAQVECLQVRMGWQKKWQNFYSSIAGFESVPGYTYRLLVLETNIANPPADGSSLSYNLIRMLSKKSKPTDNPLLGNWTLIGYNSITIRDTRYTLSFEKGKISGKFCNNMFGSYILSGNTISSPGLARTKMYCEGQPMALEDAFSLDGATYSLQALRLMVGSTSPTMQLIITTKRGDIFTYGMR